MGVAAVNVVNENFLTAETDVDVLEGELDLSFRRVYNSQSEHDANNDDGSTPSVYGNRWTNNLDIHLASSGTGSTRTISLYTVDGARDDYLCNITEQAVCTSETPGIYDMLATTQVTSGIACQLQWTQKSGVSYVFDAPYSDCTSNDAGYYGRLLAIYGRNLQFSLALTYHWSPNDKNPENIAKITVTHEPDGAQLILTFGQLAGSGPTELSSVTRPDGETINYHYTSAGFLADVDKPGNMAVLPKGESLPQKFLDGNPIATGNVPETYDITQPGTLEACGPRAAISIIDTNGSPTDGACVDFDYNKNSNELTDWYTRGVLNPTPDDGVISSPIQNGPKTGFAQWDDTTYFNNQINGDCGAFSEMSDAYGHATEWCYDSSSRVTSTSSLVSASTWQTVSQTWDSNNNLTSTTNPRGLVMNLAYDSSGNLVEAALPKQESVQPTFFFDHDSYNNLTKYCDPANNAANGWNPNPGPTPCAASGSTYFTKLKYYSNDTNEPYGCLTDAWTPNGSTNGYHHSFSYSNSYCGTGLVYQIVGDGYSEDDGTNRKPTQTFTYNTNGTIASYNAGDPDGAVWQINYTSNGMNRIRSMDDPDGVISYSCYNLDGSTFYNESAYQHSLDSSPSCPSVSQLENGVAPPKFATAYGFDADGDSVTVTNHHNCPNSNGNCPANNNALTTCNSVTVAAGMTCNFYDGLDRLVEVKLPYDSNVDIYTNPWITRYLYDITGNSYEFQKSSAAFYGHGNLFETEELLPANATVTETPAPDSRTNSTYTALKGFGYDALDRPVVKYSATGNSSYTTETLTWDASFVNSDDIDGFLGSDCNSASPQQCQGFDYYPDGQEKTFESSDNSAPERGYSYDPDGRVTQITSATHTYPQTYTYGVGGNLKTATDASSQGLGTGSQATTTYNRYPDGSLESRDIASGTLNQTGLFSYSYRNDGPLQTEVINSNNIAHVADGGKTTLTYAYTDAGRLASRGETGAGAYPSPTPQTTITYQTGSPSGAPLGLVAKEVTPVTKLSQLSYTAENEITGITSSASVPNCTGPFTYSYSLRGEVAASPGCPNYVNIPSLYANGVALRGASGFFGSSETQYTWNDLMAVLTGSLSLSCMSNACSSGWGYDAAGRMTTQTAPYPPFSKNAVETKVSRTYDAENHLRTTTLQAGFSTSAQPYVQVDWGPDGHPITITGAPKGSGGSLYHERTHWNAAQLLFTTDSYQTGGETLDDVKVDTQGDILPGTLQAQGYNGLTFYDRGPGGTGLGCHNVNGTTFVGVADSFLGIAIGNPCNAPPSGPPMPTSLLWGGNPYSGYVSVGDGGTLGLPRPDGFADGFDIIQGVRSFDPTAGVWTTPDTYAGSLFSPASLNSYLWNDNNPINNTDPSGYDDGDGGSGANPVGIEDCDDSVSICLTAGGSATPAPDPTPPPFICDGPCVSASGGGCDVACQAPGVGNMLNAIGGPDQYPGCLACRPTPSGPLPPVASAVPFGVPTPPGLKTTCQGPPASQADVTNQILGTGASTVTGLYTSIASGASALATLSGGFFGFVAGLGFQQPYCR